MIVRCIKNNIFDFQKDALLTKQLSNDYHTDGGQIKLTPNKQYVVYAIEFWNSGWPRYYICDDLYERIGYPLSYYAPFFEIVDASLSKYWSFHYHEDMGRDQQIKKYPLFAFSEWAKDRAFFERLVDGCVNEKTIFEKYKKLIDEEVTS